MKMKVITGVGVLGSLVTSMFGGWTKAMTTLLIFMIIDYITGLVVAGVFHKSPKSENGALESKAGWKGLCRKGMILLFVLVGHRLDLVIGASYIKDAVCIAFIVNELISLIENAALMGVPIPQIITKAIDLLQKAEEGVENE
ncbi:MAG: phage holin family protein [Clostridia bacterium]|nr:phage holin family protein [Clostridia bacterium]